MDASKQSPRTKPGEPAGAGACFATISITRPPSAAWLLDVRSTHAVGPAKTLLFIRGESQALIGRKTPNGAIGATSAL
jgi:hypothetical protein